MHVSFKLIILLTYPFLALCWITSSKLTDISAVLDVLYTSFKSPRELVVRIRRSPLQQPYESLVGVAMVTRITNHVRPRTCCV